jgi:von Willebrand factor type A domain
LVVDGDSSPIENLDPSAFTLQACSPDPANERTDCMRGDGADVAYLPSTPAPQSLTQIAAGLIRPYAATLLLDQSGSIAQTDPTGARLFAGKVFLGSLGSDDRALLSAFADGAGAKLPTTPLTVYGAFKDRAQAPSYFPILDSLMPLLGGDTPLYDSIDALGQQFGADPLLPSGLARAIVVFTDGADTRCATPAACSARRAQTIRLANDNGIRLFTIGLSSGVDVAALGDLAHRTGGSFLYADSAEQLVPLYGSLGKLLSLGLPTYRLSWTVQADSAGALRQGDTLLGQVRVQVGNSSLNVPFAVGIP